MMRLLKVTVLFLLASWAFAACAPGGYQDANTIGKVLCNIKVKSFQGVYKLVFMGAYVTGLGVFVAAIFKLKQVKDNPTQIPVTTPVALFLCGTILMLLPSILRPAGETIFGSTSNSAYSIDSGGNISDQSSNVSLPNLLDR